MTTRIIMSILKTEDFKSVIVLDSYTDMFRLEGSPLVLVTRRAGQSMRSLHFTMGEQYLQCSPPPCLQSHAL